jgi:membrane associated rhomboid family serine protease
MIMQLIIIIIIINCIKHNNHKINIIDIILNLEIMWSKGDNNEKKHNYLCYIYIYTVWYE